MGPSTHLLLATSLPSLFPTQWFKLSLDVILTPVRLRHVVYIHARLLVRSKYYLSTTSTASAVLFLK